ncbi:hypothetical protein G3N56_06135 [Desulfovibrio sulfodismutans]|uniref:Uncharacterized protein n=1 Tax=Desulfolutivibrio sulfodismutans TaxID=63561 RepID=A0A7K3NJD9_9BACT|nr:hypothetical protein [Desulfolutivibrio sulfodismutans]NDY56321.1 hypothetical protein [Desulfolutivibrio sulfodismutans]QLA11507.1 hypothetical protein GD606_04060 [Desulfolutivibrio sulfodismutans DSM 3696]QLA14194.1 hypothetical protein GD606_18940 [Desulfolutivibrio sulfodismutans DSM 3696]
MSKQPPYPETLGDITYAALRPTLDVFVVTWIGDSPLSRAIRHFAPGGSHTSIGLRLYGSLFLAEAMIDGFVLSRASRRFHAYDGEILIHPLDLTPDQAEAAKQLALNLISARLGYGFRTLLALAWRTVRMTMRRPVCSQAGTYILVEAGVIPPQFTVLSPGGLRFLLPRPWRLAPYSKEGDR